MRMLNYTAYQQKLVQNLLSCNSGFQMFQGNWRVAVHVIVNYFKKTVFIGSKVNEC